jgi:hypothetical protein
MNEKKSIFDPRIIEFPKIGNSEFGYISVAENENLPFKPNRIYWTYLTPENVKRGFHAHYELEQILIAVSGKIEVYIETINGHVFQFILDNANTGLFLPRMSWHTMKYSQNAVQLCIASEKYDEKDYIRDYSEFLKNKNEI